MPIQASEPTLKEYSLIFIKDWSSAISGGLSVPLTVFSLYFHNTVGRVCFAVLAVICLFVPSYRIWADERRRGLARLDDLKPQIERQLFESEANSRELVALISTLNEMERNLLMWRGIVKDTWGIAPDHVKLVPDNWSSIVFQSQRISPALREKVDAIGADLTKAISIIVQFLAPPANYRNPTILPPPHTTS